MCCSVDFVHPVWPKSPTMTNLKGRVAGGVRKENSRDELELHR
uniref:Uncharacterized protein n=1 Tax=Arundo donax TaxID=35708 RepID=A0A0A9BMN3_ARUDO